MLTSHEFSYYNVLKQILLIYGIPARFPTDKRTVFEYTLKGKQDIEKDTFTRFSYACKELGTRESCILQQRRMIAKSPGCLNYQMRPGFYFVYS